jgi:hypothetical protein
VATLLLLAGEESKIVSERLGHSSTRLRQDAYQHVLPGMEDRASVRLDAIFKYGCILAREDGKKPSRASEGHSGSAVG